ncbi:MAG: antibiotic biosynthesis monooxygenase, partial [Mesorhizobium sp.]
MSTTVTLINVFTAKPGKQQELARTLAEGNFFSKQPGSLSSSVV